MKLLQKKRKNRSIFENDFIDEGAVFNISFGWFSVLSTIISSGNILDLPITSY